MLPVDLQEALIGRVLQAGPVGIPAFVGMTTNGSDPVWALPFRPREFVIAVEDKVWRLPPTMAPFLANVWSRLAVSSFDSRVLQYFDRQAGVLPYSFTDFGWLTLYTQHLLRQTGYDPVVPTSILFDSLSVFQDLDDGVYLSAAEIIRETEALYRGPLKAFAPYTVQWQQARQLLDLMASRGYVVPDVLALTRSDVDGLLHPMWALPIVPGRITTAQPPLHALKRSLRDQFAARTGSRWVLVTWPEVVSTIASLVVSGLKRHADEGDDWLLGRHDVPPPPDTGSGRMERLKTDWLETQRCFPIPTPASPVAEYSAGRMCLEAVSAFTVAQLATLYQSWRRDEPVLLGLSDVMPYLGSLAFQIDDRVPLHLLAEYFTHLHAFHVDPVLTVGQTRGAMYPIAAPLTPVALDLDKPAAWPVDCPVCRKRADCERDLLQHYKEDHPGVTP